MNIRLNGKTTSVKTGLTIAGLIEGMGINPGTVVVELNRNVIAAEEWDSVIISENDEIEILAFMGGGYRGR